MATAPNMTYTYDAENRIVSVDGGQTATYAELKALRAYGEPLFEQAFRKRGDAPGLT